MCGYVTLLSLAKSLFVWKNKGVFLFVWFFWGGFFQEGGAKAMEEMERVEAMGSCLLLTTPLGSYESSWVREELESGYDGAPVTRDLARAKELALPLWDSVVRKLSRGSFPSLP